MVADKVKELEQENILLKAQVEELQNICGGKANMPKNCEYCNNFMRRKSITFLEVFMFNDRLRATRISRGVTQQKTADAMGRNR